MYTGITATLCIARKIRISFKKISLVKKETNHDSHFLDRSPLVELFMQR